MRLVAALVLVGCASGPSYVRDPLGHPLSTTAVLDADSAGTELYCSDGSRYVIVEPPRSYLAGTHLVTQRVHVTNAPRLCEQIRAADR